jgi:hypothetical protein
VEYFRGAAKLAAQLIAAGAVMAQAGNDADQERYGEHEASITSQLNCAPAARARVTGHLTYSAPDTLPAPSPTLPTRPSSIRADRPN